MKKNLLPTFIILSCLLSSVSSTLAKPKDKKQQNQEEDKQSEIQLDYKNVKLVKAVFEEVISSCIRAWNPELEANAWEDAKQLIKGLQEYWQPAYQLAQKHLHKKNLNKKAQTLIQERIELINQLSGSLNYFGTQLTEATTIVEEVVMVAENFFPDSVLVADAYSGLAGSYTMRNYNFEQALEYLTKALQITIACLGEQHLKAARIYLILGNLPLLEPATAIAYLETARKIALQLPREQEGVPRLLFYVHDTLGKVHEEKGAYSQALTNYEELLELLPEFALSGEIVRAYTDIMKSRIQNAQEKIDKQKEEKKDEASEN
jgi:tetratricopeptide (TPR) repeat protein